MSDWKETPRTDQDFGSVPRAGGDVQARAGYDEGLRSYMLSIYNYMASGVLLTGIVAMAAAATGLAYAFATGPLMWIVALAPLGFILAMRSPSACSCAVLSAAAMPACVVSIT